MTNPSSPDRARSGSRSIALREELLQHVSWIRRLAGHLVSDRELAEELVQETCVVALETHPRDASKLRRWLATILRNLARQHARGEGHRRVREERSARHEAIEATDRLVERVSIQRRLADEVLALHEPYRTVVLLRFFEELPPREISRRLDVPVPTVNSRLQRALALLRDRLDASDACEDGRTWVLAVSALLSPPSSVAPSITSASSSATPLGVGLVQAKVAAWIALGVVAGAIAWTLRDAPIVEEARPIVATPRAESTTKGPSLDVARADSSSSRVSVVAPPDTAEDVETAAVTLEPVPAATPHRLRVRVLDASGAPVAGAVVRADGREVSLGTSGAGGWLELDTTLLEATLVVEDERWVTVKAGIWNPAVSFDPVVVVAPAIRIGGRVREVDGRNVAGARVAFRLPRDFRARFGDVLDATTLRAFYAPTDGDGRFVFERVPAIDGAILRAICVGFAPDEQPAPRQSDVALEFVLRRPEVPLLGALRGRVVDADGLGVEGARVGLGLTSVVSDRDGEFELDLRQAVTSSSLVAVKVGYLPARMSRPFEPDDVPGGEATGWPDFVLLTLSEPARSIRGTVVDADGRPVALAKLWIADPTPSSPIGVAPMMLEGLMAGAPIPASALESAAYRPAEDGDGFTDVTAMAGAPNALWNWVETDGRGRFEVVGLDARSYRIDVLVPDQLEIHSSAPIRAGTTDARIVVPAPNVYPRVAGVVRSSSGASLADIRVGAWIPVLDIEGRVFGGTVRVVLMQAGSETKTDADGAFVLTGVPREGARLSLHGDATIPKTVRLTRDDQPRRLELVVYQRCHLQVNVGEDRERFDSIALEDERGERLDVMVLAAGNVQALTHAPLFDGRSGIVSATDAARTLLLMRDGAIVERVALDLRPGEVNRIEL